MLFSNWSVCSHPEKSETGPRGGHSDAGSGFHLARLRDLRAAQMALHTARSTLKPSRLLGGPMLDALGIARKQSSKDSWLRHYEPRRPRGGLEFRLAAILMLLTHHPQVQDGKRLRQPLPDHVRYRWGDGSWRRCILQKLADASCLKSWLHHLAQCYLNAFTSEHSQGLNFTVKSPQ